MQTPNLMGTILKHMETRTYKTDDLYRLGLIGEIKQQERGEMWKLIEKRKNQRTYTFWRFIWTRGITDFLIKLKKKNGEPLPEKHWEWRHVEYVKTLREAKLLFDK